VSTVFKKAVNECRLYVVATVFFEKIFDDRILGPRLINNKNVFRRTIKKRVTKV
jgi:hypothetical protein